MINTPPSISGPNGRVPHRGSLKKRKAQFLKIENFLTRCDAAMNSHVQIPKFLLKKFATDDGRVFVYSFAEKRICKRPPKNIYLSIMNSK